MLAVMLVPVSASALTPGAINTTVPDLNPTPDLTDVSVTKLPEVETVNPDLAEMTCSIDGQVKLLDDGMNELTFTTFVNASEDDDSAPFTLSIKSESGSILSEKGMTQIVADGTMFVTKDGEATRKVTVDPAQHELLTLAATLDGKTCTGKQIETIKRSALVDIILDMNSEEDDISVPDRTIPEPSEFELGESDTDAPAMEEDSVPAVEEGEVGSGEAVSGEEDGSAGGSAPVSGDEPATEEGASEDGDESIDPEIVEEILASADEDVDLSDRDEVAALIEEYFAERDDEETEEVEEVAEVEEETVKAPVATTNTVTPASDDSDMEEVLMYVIGGAFGVILLLVLALIWKNGSKESTEVKEEKAEEKTEE